MSCPHSREISFTAIRMLHADRMTEINDLRRVRSIADRHAGIFTFDDARSAGVPGDCVVRVALAGRAVRLSRSAFVVREAWDDAGSWERFRLRSLAFGLGARPNVFLTGASAQAVLHLPSVVDPPDQVVAIRPKPTNSGTNLSTHAHARTGLLLPAHRWMRDRVRVVSAEYAAVDVARHCTPSEGLVIVDAVLRSGTPRERLARIVDDMPFYPGIEQARWATANGDGRAESPLESLGRLAFLESGMAAPLSNVWIDDGHRWFRVDHLLPESGVVLEGDGGLKVNARPDAHRIVRDQVVRESRIRARGFALERYDFPMAMHDRGSIVGLALRAVRQQAGRRIPTCWSLEPPAHLRRA